MDLDSEYDNAPTKIEIFEYQNCFVMHLDVELKLVCKYKDLKGKGNTCPH